MLIGLVFLVSVCVTAVLAWSREAKKLRATSEDLQASLEIERRINASAHALAEAVAGMRNDGLAGEIPDVGEGGPVREIAESIEVLRQGLIEKEKIEARLQEHAKLQALGELTGGVAHEFNNLLQSVSANLEVTIEVLSKLEGTDEPIRRLQRAIDTTFRGAKLTDQLLAYTGNRHWAVSEAVDVRAFISNASEILLPMLGETFEIETDLADDLRPIRVDPGQLEAALVNLAINARDAMGRGGRITITAETVHLDVASLSTLSITPPDSLRSGDYVMVAVRDNGHGMSPDVLAKAFDPFFTTKDVDRGRGLGLSMVFGFVVRQEGGWVDIESEAGVGTTVKLYFPARETEEEEASPPAESKTPRRGDTLAILVVEDDADVLESMILLIEGLGHVAYGARDAAKALAVIDDRGGVDVLLTDVIMPGGILGDELADKVRELHPGTNIVLMSGYSGDALTAKGIVATGSTLLRKPFSEEELERVLRDFAS